MKGTLLISMLLLLITFLGCSSRADFKRDNILDPKADTPAANFVSSGTYIKRGITEYNSFEIAVNRAVINQMSTIALFSSQDGVFFTTSEVTTDTLKVDLTELSPGGHKINLLVNEIENDELTVNVNRAGDVKIYDAKFEQGGFRITWSKYRSDDFSNYYLYRTKDGFDTRFATLIADITDVNDTVYTDFNYMMEDNFDYFVRSESGLDLNPNYSKLYRVQPDFISNDNDYSYSYLIMKNQVPFLIFLEEKNGRRILSHVNILTNEYEVISNETSFNSLYLNTSTSPNRLLAISDEENHIVYEFDLTTLNKTNTYDLINLPGVNFDYSRDTLFYNGNEVVSEFVSDITFESDLNLYFVSLGRNILTLDQNLNFISHYTAKRSITRFFSPDKINRQLFGLRKFSPTNYDIIFHQYNEQGMITDSSDINNERNIYTEKEIGAVSANNGIIVAGTKGNKFSANSKLTDMDDLISKISSFTDFYISATHSRNIYASNKFGYFVKADIISGNWDTIYENDYAIERVYPFENKFYLLERNNDKFRVLAQPIEVSN